MIQNEKYKNALTTKNHVIDSDESQRSLDNEDGIMWVI